MLVNLVKEQFSHIEQCVDQAASICQDDPQVSSRLRNCIREMEEQSDQAKQHIFHSPNNEDVRYYLDTLEKLGEQAWQVCNQEEKKNPELEGAVNAARQAVSTLKQQLH